MNRTELTLRTEVVWREFHERLRAFVSRRVRNQADVEDILQEVFIRIHRGIDSIRQQERLPAWIFQITRNVIIDHFRTEARRTEESAEDFDPPAPASKGNSDMSELQELAACIQPMIDALPESYREAIRLTDLNGLTQVTAAQHSGLSLSGMKSRVQRARRQLKDMLHDCCHIEVDRHGGIVDYSVRDVSKSPCGRCGDQRNVLDRRSLGQRVDRSPR